MTKQLSFSFPDGSEDSASGGLATWRAHRLDQLRQLARAEGLPLGKMVRVEFASGPPLEGMLVLNDNELIPSVRRDTHLPLRIGPDVFEAADISSCVVL